MSAKCKYRATTLRSFGSGKTQLYNQRRVLYELITLHRAAQGWPREVVMRSRISGAEDAQGTPRADIVPAQSQSSLPTVHSHTCTCCIAY